MKHDDRPNIIEFLISLVMGDKKPRKKPPRVTEPASPPPTKIPRGKGTVLPKGIPEIQKELHPSLKEDKEARKELFKEIHARWPKNAANIYRIMAWETNHMSSGQYRWTGSAGMEVHRPEYPYGWTSARKLWEDPMYKPIGFKVFTDGAKRRRAFLAFKSPLAFAAYLNVYLNKYRPGRWYSTVPERQARYESKIEGIKLPNLT